MHEAIEALNHQTAAQLRQVEVGSRLGTEQNQTEQLRIHMELKRYQYTAEHQARMLRLLYGALALVAVVVVALLIKDDIGQAETILTTAMVGLLALFAGPNIFGGKHGSRSGADEP